MKMGALRKLPNDDRHFNPMVLTFLSNITELAFVVAH